MRNVIAGFTNLPGSVDKPQCKRFSGFSCVPLELQIQISSECLGAAGEAALQLHRESGRSWGVPALRAAAAPPQGHFQSLGLPQAMSIWCP